MHTFHACELEARTSIKSERCFEPSFGLPLDRFVSGLQVAIPSLFLLPAFLF